jgi:hypothetical protein
MAKFEEARPTIQAIIVAGLKVTGVVLGLASAILGTVLPPLIRLAGVLIGTLFQALGVAIGAVVRIVNLVADFGRGVGDAAGKVVGFASRVGDTINGIPGKIKGALGNAGTMLLQAGKDIIQGLINGILDKLDDVGNAVGKVAGKIKGFLPGSPIKEGPLTSWNNGGAGKRLIDLLALGLADTHSVDRAMTNVATNVASSLAAPDVVRPALAMASSGVAAGVSSNGGPAIQINVEVPVGASMVEAGRAIAEALEDYYAAGGKRP